jgi:hypothetical protein
MNGQIQAHSQQDSLKKKNETQSILGLHGNGMLGIEGCEYTMGLSNHMNGFTTKRFKR